MIFNKLIEDSFHRFTPEEIALLTRIRIFVNIRWGVIAGTILATVIACYVFHIVFASIPIYIICAAIALYNLILLFQIQYLIKKETQSIIKTVREIGNLHLSLDLISLVAILHFSGGIENPFIFYFVFHMIGASIVLDYKAAYLLGSATMVIVTLLIGIEYFGIIPHINLQGFASPTTYREISYILATLATLATLIYGSIYMVTAISGELRKRQRQVLQLREDLIEQKTNELAQASKEIMKLEEEKKRFLFFLGIAAHDLKAPLTAIQGYLWVMLGGYAGELGEKQRGMLERSSLRIKELLNLISNLLDIPRIETGQILQEMKEISVAEVITSSVEDLRNLAEEKGLKIILEIPPNLPPVYGAESRLKQVMTNLIDNAIRYTAQGSITVRVQEQEKNVQVEIIDTGIGIPQDELKKIFQDFYRASNVEIKGTGLGLSIVKRIVEAHGGKIWVESPNPENNSGSKFAFTLPIR
jgi:signal transduction histidine kinase